MTFLKVCIRYLDTLNVIDHTYGVSETSLALSAIEHTSVGVSPSNGGPEPCIGSDIDAVPPERTGSVKNAITAGPQKIVCAHKGFLAMVEQADGSGSSILLKSKRATI